MSLTAMFKKLLDNVISEQVHHQLERIGPDLLKHSFLFIAIGAFKLMLNEPRSMLVAAEFNDMTINILSNVISVKPFKNS